VPDFADAGHLEGKHQIVRRWLCDARKQSFSIVPIYRLMVEKQRRDRKRKRKRSSPLPSTQEAEWPRKNPKFDTPPTSGSTATPEGQAYHEHGKFSSSSALPPASDAIAPSLIGKYHVARQQLGQASASKRRLSSPRLPSLFQPSEPSINRKFKSTTSTLTARIQPKKTQASLPSYPFPTDYADHFESPLRAYEDLEPFLQWLRRALRREKTSLHIYDPYFCRGAVVNLLKSLGFPRVTNKMRDFYADVAAGTVPSYDVLVTNPPYSDDHKEKILRFCLGSDKPWCLLLPNYVANKSYYLDAIRPLPQDRQPFYLVPNAKYEYQHPEGTGHISSPFFSIWVCNPGPIPRRDIGCVVSRLQAAQQQHSLPWRLVLTVEDLRSTGAAPSWKRPSNKRRKKMKRLMLTNVKG